MEWGKRLADAMDTSKLGRRTGHVVLDLRELREFALGLGRGGEVGKPVLEGIGVSTRLFPPDCASKPGKTGNAPLGQLARASRTARHDARPRCLKRRQMNRNSRVGRAARRSHRVVAREMSDGSIVAWKLVEGFRTRSLDVWIEELGAIWRRNQSMVAYELQVAGFGLERRRSFSTRSRKKSGDQTKRSHR